MSLVSTTSLKKAQDVLSTIDGVITAVEKIPNAECSVNVSLGNSFALLIAILESCGVTREELVMWLVKYVKYELPAIELGIKGILLANMKNMISCSIDPRIPAYAREGEENSLNDGSGMTFNLSVLDTQHKLDNGPLEMIGNSINTNYFGNNGKDNIYDFLRADDFDAFLWLLIHRSKFPNNIRLSIDEIKNKYNASYVSGTTLSNVVTLSYSGSTTSGIMPGTSFKETNNKIPSNIISVCQKANRDPNTNAILENTLMPIGTYYDRLTWYVNRKTYFDFLKVNKESNRNYNEDIGLCSFKYVDDVADSSLNDDSIYLKNKINLKILRKPFIHLPRIGQNIFVPIKILFNSDGVQDKDGRFTVNVSNYNGSEKNGDVFYLITNNSKHSAYLCVDKNGNYSILDSDNKKLPTNSVCSFLYECYPNLTIYEFNYDYIFGMKLFDSKVVVSSLINNLMNFNVGINFNLQSSLNENQIFSQKRIKEIIKKMVEESGDESSDCFYSFSNDLIDKMSMESELQRSNLIPFGDSFSESNEDMFENIQNLLNKFETETSLEENVKIFDHIVTNIELSLNNNNSNTKDSKLSVNKSLGSDLIKTFMQELVFVLVNSLLTPKLMLMISINKKLCGQSTKIDFSAEELLESINELILAMVKEIRDMILKDLMDFVLLKLKDLLKLLSERLLLEQLMVYKAIMKRLLEDCKFSRRSGIIPTTIGNVDYADIDNDKPNLEKC